ncbi:hypothetical protein Tco_1117613, partial [Tanacetum coccineum]
TVEELKTAGYRVTTAGSRLLLLKKLSRRTLEEMAFSDSEASTYKRGLDTVEAQLVTYRKNKVLFSEEVAVLKREVGCKTYEFNMLKTEFEKVKLEKEGIDFKIEKFENASKDLDKLLRSQLSDNNKRGLGYHAVPPPHPLIYNAPTKLDLSYSRQGEFKQPEFEGYGVKVDKSVCEKSSKEITKTPGAPIIEDWVSDDEEQDESKSKKKTVIPTAAKIEFVRPKQQEKPARKPVKYAEMYRSLIILLLKYLKCTSEGVQQGTKDKVEGSRFSERRVRDLIKIIVSFKSIELEKRSRFGINKWYQNFALRNFDLEDIELESSNSGPTAKLSILKLGEYEMWVIRIKQYFQI